MIRCLPLLLAAALWLLNAPVRAQLELPAAVGLEWQTQIDGLSFGYEFPLAVAALDEPGSSDRWIVGGGRIGSPYFIELRAQQSGQSLWRYEAPYPIGIRLAGAPDGGAVYALAYDPSQPPFRRASLLALNAQTGAKLWETPFTSWSGTAIVREPNELVVAADSQRIFVVGEETELSSPPVGWATLGSFRASDGQLSWFQRRGPGNKPSFAFEDVALSPDGALVLAAGGDGASQGGALAVQAFDAAAGFPLWQRALVGGRAHALACDAAILVLGCARGSGPASLYGLDPSSGSDLWSQNQDEEVLDLAFATAPGSQLLRLVTAGVDDGISIDDKNLLSTRSFQAQDGSALWSQPFQTSWGSPGSIDMDGINRFDLLALHGPSSRVVVGAGRGPYAGPDDFQIDTYDLTSGLPGWSRAIDVSPFQVGQGLRSIAQSPDGQRLALLGDDAGQVDLQGLRLESLQAASGLSQWLVTVNQGSPSANPPMDIAEHAGTQTVFVLSRLNLGIYLVLALDENSGALRWQTEILFPGNISPLLLPRLAVAGDGSAVLMYLPGSDLTELVVLEADSGAVRWQALVEPTGVLGQPGRLAVIGPQSGKLYLAVDGGSTGPGLRLRALSLFDGSLLWESDPSEPGFLDIAADLGLDPSGKVLYLAGTRTRLSGPSGDRDLLLAGFDADSGQVLFSEPFGLPSADERARALAIAPDGQRACVLGQRGGPNGPLVAAEFGLQGDLRWSRTQSGQNGGLRPDFARYSFLGVSLLIAAGDGPEPTPQAVLLGWHGPTGIPLWVRPFPSAGGQQLNDLRIGEDGLTAYLIGTNGLGSPVSDTAFLGAVDTLDGQLLWQAVYDSPNPTAGFYLEDVGQGLCLSEDGKRLFATAGVWDVTQYTDTLVVSLRLAELLGSPPAVSLANGGAQTLTLRAGPALAGDGFLVLGSASGSASSLSLDGLPLPLQLDSYTEFTLRYAGGANFPGTLGSFDALGRAQAAVVLPAGLNASLAGLTLHHAWIALDLFGTWGVSGISNALPLQLVP